MCSERELTKENRRGKVTVVSGFSGAGKGTLMEGLQKNYPGRYALSVSVTTRKPREGEVDGISYHFKTQEEFDRLIEENYFIEYARYVDNSYGTPGPFVEQNLEVGRDVILEIELQGALIAREKYPDAKLIFVTAKDADTLIDRLTGRGTETEEKIRKRLLRAVDEADGIENYDYILINGDLQESIGRLHEVIQSEDKTRPSQEDYAVIRNIQSELKRRLSI
ncbi:MAG: guanylate kinase [Lachnospiraceae bacterium]|nr:guanylate kinase [Lachnospiraceae bacterium]